MYENFLGERNEERRGIIFWSFFCIICIKMVFILRIIMSINSGVFCFVLFGEFRVFSYGFVKRFNFLEYLIC